MGFEDCFLNPIPINTESRQHLEDFKVSISRETGTLAFPALFMLVA